MLIMGTAYASNWYLGDKCVRGDHELEWAEFCWPAQMRLKSNFFYIVSCLLLLSVQANAEPKEIYVGDLIDRVISGEDFAGRELVIFGITLDEPSRDGDRLLKLGTFETYESGAYSDFVSIYDASESIEEDYVVTVRVVIVTSYVLREDEKWSAVIEATFRECLPSCESPWLSD